MKKTTVLLLSVVLFALSAAADTLVLKSGMKLHSEKIWQEGDEIKRYINGLSVGFPASDVQRIERDPPALRDFASTAATPGLDEDLVEIRKLLDKEKQALDGEYQSLFEAFKQLESDRKPLEPGFEVRRYNEIISKHNQKVAQFERKKEMFDKAVQAYAARVQNNRTGVFLDEAEFLKILSSWLKRPIDEFVDQWGRPDSIVNMPDNARQYSFLVEVEPLNTRKIIFDTNPSGEIVSLRTEIIKKSQGFP